MRIPLLLLSLLAILLVLLIWSVSNDGEEQLASVAAGSQPVPAAGSPEGAGTVEIQARPPRPISPKLFAQPFAQNALRLERIAPRQPLTPPKPITPKRISLHQPVVSASGLITFSRGQLQLAGIVVLDALVNCTDRTGDNWPCGIIARTAFRGFLRGRTLSCIAPEGPWKQTVVSQCLVGTQDPAEWLVSHGWAQAIPGSDYVKFEQIARQDQKGVYGSDPRKTKGTQY